MIFSVIGGFWISSIKYSSRRDGIAMKIKIVAGAIFHVTLIICPSSISRFTSFLWLWLLLLCMILV